MGDAVQIQIERRRDSWSRRSEELDARVEEDLEPRADSENLERLPIWLCGVACTPWTVTLGLEETALSILSRDPGIHCAKQPSRTFSSLDGPRLERMSACRLRLREQQACPWPCQIKPL